MSEELPKPQSVASAKPPIMNAPGEQPKNDVPNNPVENNKTENTTEENNNSEQNENFDSEEFVNKIFGEITKEEQDKLKSLESENDAKLKAVLQKTMEYNNNQTKQLTELLQAQQKVIEDLKGKVETLSPGSKVDDIPKDNPFTEKQQSKSNIIDVHSEHFKQTFAKKFNIPGLR